MGGRTTSSLTSSGATEFRAPRSIPGGEVAGAELVRELPAEVALPAWQTLRSVLSWAAAEPGWRHELFDPAAMEEWEIELLQADWEPDLRLPLAVIVGLLVSPEDAPPERMARACLCVTDWALEHGAVSTGLAFAEAAALSWPDQPRYAYTCGRLLRTHGRTREAEEWMRRVVRVARLNGDWDAQALGLNSVGNTLADRGNYRDAIRAHQSALRLTRKYRLIDREGEVLHDLFAASSYTGDYENAEEFARAALERYGTSHHRLATLAHDVAFLWMTRGHFARALPVFAALATHFVQPRPRLHALASAARAAGACEKAELYDDFAGQVLEIAEPPFAREGLAHATYQLALGASSLGRWGKAENLLLRAAELARATGEDDVLQQSESALQSVRLRKRTDFSVVTERGSGTPGSLSSRIVDCLQPCGELDLETAQSLR
jgi:tetratricopeptide (TPR) repeat protein